jgi:hypothetical protein
MVDINLKEAPLEAAESIEVRLARMRRTSSNSDGARVERLKVARHTQETTGAKPQ